MKHNERTMALAWEHLEAYRSWLDVRYILSVSLKRLNIEINVKALAVAATRT